MSLLAFTSRKDWFGHVLKQITIWAVLAVVSMFIARLFFGPEPVFLPINFDSNAWKANISARRNMLPDLLTRGNVIGRTRKEVEQLLGPADGDPWDNANADKDMFYQLQVGDIYKHGKYIHLIEFKIEKDKVVGWKDAREKYW